MERDLGHAVALLAAQQHRRKDEALDAAGPTVRRITDVRLGTRPLEVRALMTRLLAA